MKRYALLFLCGVFLSDAASTSASAQFITQPQAATIAENWIALQMHLDGSWGTHDQASVTNVMPFRRGERLLGYYCEVQPAGFIIVSLRRELAPIRAYSTYSGLSYTTDAGMADFLKTKMEWIIDAVELSAGPIEQADTKDIEPLLEVDYRDLSASLSQSPRLFAEQLVGGGWRENYDTGDVMLTSHWHQEPPYNDQCPDMGCDWSSYDDFNDNALVGCVATAGAQTMRHWAWPPYGNGSPYNDSYDWSNMLNSYQWWGGQFVDEDDNPCTSAQIDAVAELCAEVGQAVDMDYGCDASGAITEDLKWAFQLDFRYEWGIGIEHRSSYTALSWFALLQDELNVNRPLPYRIPGHAVVCDGWKLSPQQYHINYGWGSIGQCDGCDTWYVLDAIFGGDPDSEYALSGVVPDNALGPQISGTYGDDLYYVDQDTTTHWLGVSFVDGTDLQFLHNVAMTCDEPGTSIYFGGADGNATRLYSRGIQSRGIKVTEPVDYIPPTFKIHERGGIRFR